jgi:hypothetical protein
VHFLATFLKPDGQARQVSCSQGSRLDFLRSHDRNTEEVCLKLQQQVIRRSDAVHARFAQVGPGVFPHDVQHVGDLERKDER